MISIPRRAYNCICLDVSTHLRLRHFLRKTTYRLFLLSEKRTRHVELVGHLEGTTYKG